MYIRIGKLVIRLEAEKSPRPKREVDKAVIDSIIKTCSRSGAIASYLRHVSPNRKSAEFYVEHRAQRLGVDLSRVPRQFSRDISKGIGWPITVRGGSRGGKSIWLNNLWRERDVDLL